MTTTGIPHRHVRRAPRHRLALGALGLVALLAGLWAALILLGLDVPTPRPDFAEVHGPLMVLGFLGTLIALERAAAVNHPAGYAAPAAAGLGGLALILGLPLVVGKLLLLVGGIGLLGLYAAAARRQAAVHLGVMTGGAVAWIVAVGLWLTGWDVARLVPWLAGFLALTIAGERLELARVTRLTRTARTGFLVAAGVLVTGLVVAVPATTTGARVAGAGLLGLAVWLAAYDVTRHTIRQQGLPRFIAVCLLTGYAWLATAGVLWLRFGLPGDGRAFDAMLHALFLGFVIGMVFAHAPVIAPAVFRTPVPYRRHFYAHLTLLHASLMLRIVGGDLVGNRTVWQVGGVLNEVALLCFLAVTVGAVRTGRRAAPGMRPHRSRPLAVATSARGTTS